MWVSILLKRVLKEKRIRHWYMDSYSIIFKFYSDTKNDIRLKNLSIKIGIKEFKWRSL